MTYVFMHYKDFSKTPNEFLYFLEKYIENELYLEINNELFYDNTESNIQIKENEESFLEKCNINQYNKKSNPSALFNFSSEENNNDQLNLSSFSNSSEIINIINETLQNSNIDSSTKTKFQILKGFYSYINMFINRYNSEIETIEININKFHVVYGRISELGLFGIEMDHSKAYKRYQLAAMKNYPYGIYYYAKCYEFGIGCSKEAKTAIDLYRTSAKLGCIPGIYRYALICLKNDNVLLGMNYMRQATIFKEKELKETTNSIFNVPNMFNCPYFYHYGTLYMINHSQLVSDLPYAYSIFLKGAKLGCKHSMYMVAEFHEKGTVVKNDMKIACQYYAKAALLGQSDAQVKIGKLLISKQNDTFIKNCNNTLFVNCKNYIELGLSMLEKSAFSGNSKGMIALAECFYLGLAGIHDVLQALWWYKIAASLGENVANEIKKAENYILHNKYNGF